MIGGGARIGDQVAGDDAVDEDEDNQREQEKEADGCDVIENGPECVGLRHTAGWWSSRIFFQIIGNEQHRAAQSAKPPPNQKRKTFIFIFSSVS